MKKTLIAAALMALSIGTASATTPVNTTNYYTFVNDSANLSPMHGQGFSIVNWTAGLQINSTGNSTVAGVGVGSDHKVYAISMTLKDTYFANGNQYWGTFHGTLMGNGRTIYLNDLNPTRDQFDAVLGINATPYNNGLPTGNTPVLEFGFWGDDNPAAGGNRNSDVNVHVRCVASTTVTVGANGACVPRPSTSTSTSSTSTSTSSSTGRVPLPGTVALLGLGLVAVGAMKRRQA
jgi:hypothetical protein